MQHDDDFAEEIMEEEADMYRNEIIDKVPPRNFCILQAQRHA